MAKKILKITDIETNKDEFLSVSDLTSGKGENNSNIFIITNQFGTLDIDKSTQEVIDAINTGKILYLVIEEYDPYRFTHYVPCTSISKPEPTYEPTVVTFEGIFTNAFRTWELSLSTGKLRSYRYSNITWTYPD